MVGPVRFADGIDSQVIEGLMVGLAEAMLLSVSILSVLHLTDRVRVVIAGMIILSTVTNGSLPSSSELVVK